MKKHFIYLTAAALASGLAACSNDELDGTSSFAQGGFTLTASIENAEIPSTRVSINESAKFSWIQGDAIGLFDGGGVKENGSQKAYKFEVKESGNFGRATGVEVPSTFNPDYAVYPFDFVDENNVDLTLGEFLLELPGSTLTPGEGTDEAGNPSSYTWKNDIAGAIDWTAAVVKMPMAGTVTANTTAHTFSTAFKNLTALMKLTVKNIPEGYDLAVLEAKGNNGIAGSATVTFDADDKPSLALNGDKVLKAIVYKISTDDANVEGSTKTFYFPIPAGAYSQGLHFFLDKSSSSAPIEIQTKALNAKQNWLYASSFSLSDDGEIQSDVIATVNSKLAEAADKSEVELPLSADVTEEGIVLYLPKDQAKANTKTITLNITGLKDSYSTKTITIKEDPIGKGEVAAKNLIIKTDATAATNVPTINVNLPNSNVTLGNGEAQFFGTVSATVGSADQLNVESKVTATAISVGGGDIFVKAGALTTGTAFTSNDQSAHFLYAEDSSNVTTGEAGKVTSPLQYAPMFIYQLKTTKDGTVNVDAAALTAPINIENATNLTINLNGKAITSTAALLNLKNSTVTIVDKVEGKESGNGGSISTTLTSGYSITLDNSVLNLTDGTISASAHGIEAKGESTQFNMTGGTLSPGTNYTALKLSDSAKASITGGTYAKGEMKLYTKAEAKVTVAYPNGKKITVNEATLTYNNANTALSEIENTKGIVTITAKSAGNITNSGTLNLTTTGAVGAVTTSGTGKATISAASAGAVTSGADLDLTATTGNIGTVSVTAGTTDINAEGAEATVGNLTINGANAVLNLNGGAAGTVTATNGTFKMVDGTSTGAITQTKGTVNIEGGKVTATDSNVALTVADTAIIGTADGESTPVITSASAAIVVKKDAVLTINKGAITSTGADAITNASDNAATININGGTIEAKTAEKSALTIASATTVTVKGGEITGAASAIALSAGTLNVPSGDPTFSGANVIVATGTANGISLDAEDAEYVSTTGENAVKDTTTNGAIKSISNGWFSGDITSTYGKYFIKGGHFQKCNNLQESGSQYFMTFYKLSGESNGYWNVAYTPGEK